MRRSPSSRARRAGLVAAALAAALAGCTGEREPEAPREWRALARDFRPTSLPEAARAWRPTVRGDGDVRLAMQDDPYSPRFLASLPPRRWTRRSEGLWSAERPMPGPAAGISGAAAALTRGGEPCAALDTEFWLEHAAWLPLAGPIDDMLTRPFHERLESPSFLLTRSLVFLYLPDGDEPGDGVVLTEIVPLGSAAEGTWRVPLLGALVDGIPVLAGQAEELAVTVPPSSALRFSTVAVTGVDAPDGEATHFRVRLDGEVLLDHAQLAQPGCRPVEHVVQLGAARPDARLRLEVDGPAAVTAFLTPTIGPLEIGTPQSRPWPERPDVVFLLADTYRADNLAAWGGDPALAPHLNDLAQGCRRFLRAQTAATWTLPSHASFFSGLYPRQAGMVKRRSRLAPEAHTLAEHFSQAGYRTVAITERGFVSSMFGLDQGFEWFEEHSRGIEHTVARALERAERDDGRPLFLFVHSYRAHDPYVVSEATRARLTQRSFDASFQELGVALGALVGQAQRGVPYTGELERLTRDAETLYRGAAADLDAGFGELLAGLRGRARTEDRDVLVFTSDHGESFGEHGVIGHGMSTSVEEAHVPLFLRGPGIEAGDVEDPVSLISLPRTLSALAGIAPYDAWMGRDLCGAPAPLEAPLAVYQCSSHAPTEVALTDGARKLVLVDGRTERPELLFAYDVAADPGERTDLKGEPWVRGQLWVWTETLEELATPLLEGGKAELSTEQDAQLKALGYAGD